MPQANQESARGYHSSLRTYPASLASNETGFRHRSTKPCSNLNPFYTLRHNLCLCSRRGHETTGFFAEAGGTWTCSMFSYSGRTRLVLSLVPWMPIEKSGNASIPDRYQHPAPDEQALISLSQPSTSCVRSPHPLGLSNIQRSRQTDSFWALSI